MSVDEMRTEEEDVLLSLVRESAFMEGMTLPEVKECIARHKHLQEIAAKRPCYKKRDILEEDSRTSIIEEEALGCILGYTL
ncbi:hypothetical protein GF358_03795 [Candidatus Woesearchaeota archaeon]|nr:hypothetical protein [Candidatus Woesearchaeota archaeon]